MSSSSNSTVLKRADSTTIEDKFLVGYQGWFTCPGDGRPVHNGHHGWLHWFNKPLPDGGKPSIDPWPDVSEYTPDELFPVPWYTTSVPPSSSSTPCTCPCSASSEPHYHPQLFSSRHPKTVRRHFNWMAQVGVDGVFLQRFVGQCCPIPSSHSPDHHHHHHHEDPRHHHHHRHGTARCDIMHIRDEVTSVVRSAAEHKGRVWAIMYDVTGVPDDEIEVIVKADWIHLMRDLKILDSSSYLREEGRAVLALWGFGFSNRGHSPRTIRRITQFIRSVTPGGAYIMAGTPTHWANLCGDADPNPEFFELWFDEFDAISPWTVGRYNDEESIDRFAKEKLVGDLKKIKEVERDRERDGRCGEAKTMDYVPVIFPGSSGFNLSHGKWAFNEQPRDGGRFLWRQIYQVKRLVLGEGSHTNSNSSKSESGAGRKRRRIVYGAMWDEYDEGTAFLPVVSKKRELPREGKFLALDSDGYDLPPDWYLRIAGFIAESVRGERAVGETFPVKDLQDYWSSHPKYEILPEPVASSVSGPSTASSATASGSVSGGVNGEGSGGVGGEDETQAQSFDEWCAHEGKEVEDVPPPPYTLEATDPQPVPVPVSSTTPAPVQVNEIQQRQEQPPVPTQTRPSSLPTASIAPNVPDGSASPPVVPVQSRPSMASRPASHPGSAPYHGPIGPGSGPVPLANTSNTNLPYRVYSSSRPSRPGTAVAAGGGGAGGASNASQPSQPNWNTRPQAQVQGGGMGALDERFGRQSLSDTGPVSSRPPVTPTSAGAAPQWPPAEWGAPGQQSSSPSSSYPIQSRPSFSSHRSFSQPHSPAFPQSSLASPSLPSPRPSSSGHSPSTVGGYAHRPPPPPAHPASRPTLSVRPSTSPRPPVSPRPPPPPSPSSRPHPSVVGPGPGMPSGPVPEGFAASAFPQPYGHAQESAYLSAYPDVTQGYVNAGSLGAGVPSPTGGGPGYDYNQGYGYGSGGRYAGTGYEEGAGGFYAGPGMPLGPGPERPFHHGGPALGIGSGTGGFPAALPMLARMSHDIQHMPSISPGQIMPGTSPHPPAAQSSGSPSATTSPASASSVPAPPWGSGGFVPGGSAGAGRFGDLGSKISSTGQKILPSETWKRVE